MAGSSPRVDRQYLIVGLGNPGREYARTRHNAGFLLTDRIGRQWHASWTEERRFKARLAKVDREDAKVVLAQPLTFMNASGEAVGALVEFYKIPLDKVLVLVDDADLPFGQIRLRGKGSSGGHHGLESIESHLASREVARLKIGIGRREADGRQIAGYVLGQFAAGEMDLLEKILKRASDQVECWLDQGLEMAMTRFNGTIA